MALKMDRQVDATEIGYFLNEVAERGVVVAVNTGGSGIALDSPVNLATVKGATSGTRPLGILMNDFVDVDRTRLDVNHFKDQHAVGDKCTILTKGWIVTNKIVGTPQAGQTAVMASSGFIAAAADPNAVNRLLTPVVGRFRSGVSQDGFARVYVDL